MLSDDRHPRDDDEEKEEGEKSNETKPFPAITHNFRCENNSVARQFQNQKCETHSHKFAHSHTILFSGCVKHFDANQDIVRLLLIVIRTEVYKCSYMRVQKCLASLI